MKWYASLATMFLASTLSAGAQENGVPDLLCRWKS